MEGHGTACEQRLQKEKKEGHGRGRIEKTSMTKRLSIRGAESMDMSDTMSIDRWADCLNYEMMVVEVERDARPWSR